MILTYGLRLVCLLLVVVASIHAILDFALSAGRGPILRFLDSLTARQRERALYLLQIAPLLTAVVFAATVCVPEYLLHEPNNPNEPVSGLCIFLASTALLWFGSAAYRGAGLTLRTFGFVRACRDVGNPSGYSAEGLPVVTLRGGGQMFALVGLFRPTILVSQNLLQSGALDDEALGVALDHERSHAANLDNWKIWSLAFIPHLRLPVTAGENWMHHWQNAAEWAADDDAVRDDPARSFLLAEILVKVARCSSPSAPRIVHTALTCGEAGLAARVERLLQDRDNSDQPRRPVLAAISAMALGATAAAAAMAPWVYTLSEHLLHLG